MLRILKSLGTPADELRELYLTFILPRLMHASPVWPSSLTSTQQQQLEDVHCAGSSLALPTLITITP
ncbi:hypothetical protein E2C01_004337 [Portunus trituberculatus]|uniref:Uncharacterized protein n=1 Tax=Portunus trituberculatus TaxID=210409 RepID=A0A5B7CTS5_PORTR|nr:hypothetical protein [Portunus trituberculatus]